MQKIFELWRRIRFLLRLGRFNRELEEEMRFHLEMKMDENVARGMTAEEARRAALRQFGNRTLLHEASTEVWGGAAVKAVAEDARHGLRTLVKHPAHTAAVVTALALGVGANTAVFSVVNALLLRPLPYREAGRLVVLWERDRARSRERNVVSPWNFFEWRSQSRSFESMAAFYDWRFNLTGAGKPAEVPVQMVSGDLFTLLGAEAALGRAFSPQDAEPGRPGVGVISHDFWHGQFGGARDAVGKKIELNGQEVTIVGVMPPGFKWFVKENSLRGKPAVMWMPAKLTPQTGGRFASVVGRLRPGVNIDDARAEMNDIAARLGQKKPDLNAGWGVTLVPLREQLSGELRAPLLILFGCVTFVLLICCANVASLMLARYASRSNEFALRAALGAGRPRLVRQVLVESALLSLLGGLAGLGVAALGVGSLVALSPPNLIAAGDARMSLPVLGFTFAVSLLTGVVFGLLPALKAARFDLNDGIKQSGRRMGGAPHGRHLRGAFVVAQVALALVLLVGAGLMIRSFSRLQSVDHGFDPENLLTMRVLLSEPKYRGDRERIAFFREATERIGKLPGVRSAATVSALPFADLGATTKFTVEGRPAPAAGEEPVTDVRVADENYFVTMGIPIISGRGFSREEAAERRRTVVINEAFARKYFPGESPLGRRVRVEMEQNPPPREIVGVVGDARYERPDAEPRPMVYETPPEFNYDSMFLVVRTEADPPSLAGPVRREIQTIDPDQPVSDLRAMEDWLGDAVSRSRFGTYLLTGFALVALLLAAVGVYGVTAYSVAQRTHEIGVRVALGARTGDVLKLILGRAMRPALAGVLIGLVCGVALTRVVSGLLFGVSATDPGTFAGVALLITASALLACLPPALRAAKVDPVVTLRAE